MIQRHTVKSFDEELKNLDGEIAEMGRLCLANLAESVNAILKHDSKRAEELVRADLKIDELEHELTQRAIDLVALRQPMAADLRTIVAALKTASALERIGDYAKNIAKRSIAVAAVNSIGPVNTLGRLSDAVAGLLKAVLESYATRDVAGARQVIVDDNQVDVLHTSLFRELLTYMMEDPRTITTGIHLLFVAKNLERVGDQATNIAENLLYVVEGGSGFYDRSKADVSSLVAATQPARKK
jgi:phosphate transport system protein